MHAVIANMLFDQEDHELLRIVNEVVNKRRSRKHFKKLLRPYLHPHGIKEMAASKELRIASAVIHLLSSLEAGKAKDRLNALRSLHDEVLHIAESSFYKNTARVLLQIMKELVRAQGNPRRQLELAHDFRTATAGKPRVIRRLLRRHHLLEMPETWNQIAFDDHVHDVHTKGRKSPSHLIMDAWIKGIRALTVIYYNFVEPQAAAELLEAAQIMGITVRIGIELSARFRDQYIQFMVTPRGFYEAQDFLAFLAKPAVQEFTNECQRVSEYQQQYVLLTLNAFNDVHRQQINAAYNIRLAPITDAEFLAFVGEGQPSLLHLAELIHAHLLPEMQARVAELRTRCADADEQEQQQIAHCVADMNQLTSEVIFDRYLRADHNPTLPDPDKPRADPNIPPLLTLSPLQLIERLNQFHSGYRITLNLSNLRVEDVLELLYDCQGKITHLEIFNLKDYAARKTDHYTAINALQTALNAGNVITLKRLIREMIQQVEREGLADVADRAAKLTHILHDIATLKDFYKDVPLKACMGSDSTGRASHLQHGMGLAIKETLPPEAHKAMARKNGTSWQGLPAAMTASLQFTYVPVERSASRLRYYMQQYFPMLSRFGQKRREDWVIQENLTRLKQHGNLITLGGLQEVDDNGLYLQPQTTENRPPRLSWTYLNSDLKNVLKVLSGFIPAFISFALTKDWWLLTYGGAWIWFGITGLRNVLQFVLGGGGLRRTPLLHWHDYVSWDRLADSLMFTGFSVPLLDYVVKTLLLDRTFGITTVTNPNILYTVMALVNGIYLSSHNILRGFPRSVVIGNFFRSVLSIPIALGFNLVLGGILASAGAEDVAAILQKWAAIISKAASDCVAGILEGIEERYRNIAIRRRDYEGKIAQLLATYSHLELLFPETDVLEMLKSPKQLLRKLSAETRDLERILIINALDLMYFWMYQPRGRSAFRQLLRTISLEEIQIITRSQAILERQRDVSKMFIDGIIGNRFSRGLAFYLDRSNEYLRDMNKLASQSQSDEQALNHHEM